MMAGPNLTNDEEKEVQGFLEEITQGRDQITWNTAIKFLMARKFDRKRAIELFQNHECTRKREGLIIEKPLSDLIKKELNTGKFTVLKGRDKFGAAIALFTARLHNPALVSHQLVLKALVYQLDVALESHDTQRHGLVFIYDMTDSKYGNFDYELSKKILNMLKGGYPARLKKVLIVTAPLWFKAPFKILRLFVREKLRDRVYTISMTQLTQHIPKESLPSHLGGSASHNHPSWLQVCANVNDNQLDELCSYFSPPKRRSIPGSSGARGSLSGRSLSSDMSDSLMISDLDSEDSKDTVTEKHSSEEKEKDDNSHEKEVSVEKQNQEINGSVKRRRESDSLDKKEPMESSDLSNHEPQSNSDKDSNSDYPPKKRPVSDVSNNIYESSIHKPEPDGLTIAELAVHCQQLKRKGLYEEYALIKMEPPAGTFTVSKAKYNIPKNRYSDVLCFDHSRVQLPTDTSDPSADYINANYMDGYLQKNAYISTQGPLPKTFGDFWRMVWHCQVMVVVMTTKTMERSRVKCGQYWPIDEDKEEQFDEFMVINTGIEQHQDYTISGLFLLNTKTDESRHITHLQYTGWPDYGVPASAASFLDFLYCVRSCQADATQRMGTAWKGHPWGPPVIVHCSAGIGRTGTFMTIDICLRKLEATGNVDVRETVRRIRSQRAFSIQMPDQYVFCHLAVLEHEMREGRLEAVDWSGFDDSDSESD